MDCKLSNRLGHRLAKDRLSRWGEFEVEIVIESTRDHIFQESACLRQIVEVSPAVELEIGQRARKFPQNLQTSSQIQKCRV